MTMTGTGWAIALLLAQAGPAPAEPAACVLPVAAAPSVAEMLAGGLTFPEYRDLCAWLVGNGLEVDVAGSAGVLAERAFAWSVIRLRRTDDGRIGPRTITHTMLSERATDAEARAMLRRSVSGSLSELWATREGQIEVLRRAGAAAAQ